MLKLNQVIKSLKFQRDHTIPSDQFYYINVSRLLEHEDIKRDLIESIKELESDLSYAPNTRVGFQIIREMIENND